VAAGSPDTFLGERSRRLAKRRGTNKAIVAVGRSVLVIPSLRDQDLGPRR
jgi:transposase